MRALSLWQPWASLIALGRKRFETRSWRTPYRGLVAIHAARIFPRAEQSLCDVWPFNRYLNASDLPLGCIVAVGELVAVQKTEHIAATLSAAPMSQADFEELHFGNYARGRLAWAFKELRALRQPVPCRGYQGLWNLDLATEQMVIAELP